MTVVLAYFPPLRETLSRIQYLGVIAVIAGCLAIAYEPSDPTEKTTTRRFLGMPVWFVLIILAVLIWGITGVLDKWVYSLPNASVANFILFGIFTEVLTTGLYGVLREREWTFSVKEGGCAAIPVVLACIADFALYIAYNIPDSSASIMTNRAPSELTSKLRNPLVSTSKGPSNRRRGAEARNSGSVCTETLMIRRPFR